MSVLSWAGFFLMAVVLPLVLLLVEKDRNRFTRWHAAEALNFQLTFLVLWLGTFLPIWGTFYFGAIAGAEPPGWLVALFPALFALYGLGALVSVLGAVRAWQGRWWRCPVAVPFLRAHRRERATELARVGAA